jgi:hypothetical protein
VHACRRGGRMSASLSGGTAAPRGLTLSRPDAARFRCRIDAAPAAARQRPGPFRRRTSRADGERLRWRKPCHACAVPCLTCRH